MLTGNFVKLFCRGNILNVIQFLGITNLANSCIPVQIVCIKLNIPYDYKA
jgi:hypothetical protein